MFASSCSQAKVLKHPFVRGFLIHSEWNSTIESISYGLPMICWPFFADQQTNCWFCCTKWGIGLEIDNNVKRDDVERLVTELMVGEKGKKMKRKALSGKDWWKQLRESLSSILRMRLIKCFSIQDTRHVKVNVSKLFSCLAYWIWDLDTDIVGLVLRASL